MFRMALVCIVCLGMAVSTAFAEAVFDSRDFPRNSRLKKITAKNLVKIAYRTDAAPFSFLNNQKEPVGYTIDLCKLVVASIEKQTRSKDLKIEWVPVTTQTRFEAILNGNADMECGASTITLRRMKDVDFSSIVFVETTGLVVKTAAGINSAADLTGKKVAVIARTTNEQVLANLQQQRKLDIILVPVKDRGEGIAALSSGKADAFASDKLLLLGADIRDANAFKLLPDDLSFEPYGIALPRGDWALRLVVNTGLAQTYRGGQASEIFKKWFEQVGLRPIGLMGAAYQLGALPE